MLAEVTGTVSFGKDTKGKQRLVNHRPGRREPRVPDPEGKAGAGARRPGGEQGRDDRGRPGRSARHPAPAGHREARDLHRRRSAGRLSPARREDQRQAHRGDRAPDAAPREHRRSGRHGVHPRRAGRALGAAQRERPRRRRRKAPRDATRTCCWASPRPRCRPTRSSRPRPSRKRPACSPKPPSWASATTCAASRKTSSSAASSRRVPAWRIHVARKDKEALEAAEREAARQLANPFEDAPATVGSDAHADEEPGADA